MAAISIVRRYAEALFRTAEQQGLVEKVEADLLQIQEILRDNPRLQRALKAPTLSIQQKNGLLDATLGERISPLTRRFLHLLVEKRRESALQEAPGEFHRLADRARGRSQVQVWSATPLSDDQSSRLRSALEQRTGKSIVLHLNVDPELLGGVVVQVGDTIIDGSIRNKLTQLRQLLLSGRQAARN